MLLPAREVYVVNTSEYEAVRKLVSKGLRGSRPSRTTTGPNLSESSDILVVIHRAMTTSARNRHEAVLARTLAGVAGIPLVGWRASAQTGDIVSTQLGDNIFLLKGPDGNVDRAHRPGGA